MMESLPINTDNEKIEKVIIVIKISNDTYKSDSTSINCNIHTPLPIIYNI